MHSHSHIAPRDASQSPAPVADDDLLLTTAQTRARIGGVSRMCIWRWMRDPRVQFPAPDLTLNSRHYWRLGAIRAWQERMTSDTHARRSLAA